jgi:hypothetical protein
MSHAIRPLQLVHIQPPLSYALVINILVAKCIQNTQISVDLDTLVWVPGHLTCAFVSWAQNGHECYLSEWTKKALYHELISLILCTSLESFWQTMSKEHLRGKYFLIKLCIMSLVLYWNDHICIKVGAPKLFCILQNYVGMAGFLTMCIPGFLLRILWCSQSGGHPENNLAKFGYILEMKVEKNRILLCFWLSLELIIKI